MVTELIFGISFAFSRKLWDSGKSKEQNEVTCNMDIEY